MKLVNSIPSNWKNNLKYSYQALTNYIHSYMVYSKLQIAVLVNFWQVQSQTHFGSHLSTRSNSQELGVHVLFKNLYIRFLKPIVWHVFHFMFHAFHRMILNLILVSKINLQWSWLLAFSKVGKTFNGEAKI